MARGGASGIGAHHLCHSLARGVFPLPRREPLVARGAAPSAAKQRAARIGAAKDLHAPYDAIAATTTAAAVDDTAAAATAATAHPHVRAHTHMHSHCIADGLSTHHPHEPTHSGSVGSLCPEP